MAGPQDWDYLIVTASNDRQGEAYEKLLAVRRDLGLLPAVGEVLVVPDLNGRRIGSGGSTVQCLLEVLARELPASADPGDAATRLAALRKLRILVVHAGGDSRRLPAYGPCGKIFLPVPGEADTALPTTLFDRQLPTYLALGAPAVDRGQVVIVAGDVLLSFDPAAVDMSRPGLIGLGCRAAPAQASRHGVYCADADGTGRLVLQKPSVTQQQARGAVDRYGQSVLDIGVISFDGDTAERMLALCDVCGDDSGRPAWSGPVADAAVTHGLDFYREICCALGADATAEHYIETCRASGSRWPDDLLAATFDALHPVPLHVQVLPHCGFLHFGTTSQIIDSGAELLRADTGVSQVDSCLRLTVGRTPDTSITGQEAWVEACRLNADLSLGGRNVVVGVDVDQSLSLPTGACLDILPGRPHGDTPRWFVRCYGVEDRIKDTIGQGATFCGRTVREWLTAVGVCPCDVWDEDDLEDSLSIWDARLFVAVDRPSAYRDWLWMFDPTAATDAQKQAWRSAERYSFAEMATLTDQDAFHARRYALQAASLRKSLRWTFRLDSDFSARELAWTLAHAHDRADWAAALAAEARWHGGHDQSAVGLGAFACGRILHTLGSAVAILADSDDTPLVEVLGDLSAACDDATGSWLGSLAVPTDNTTVGTFASAAKAVAFGQLGGAIVSSAARQAGHPRSALRRDEIVWGRAPARLDLGGGWTDTPPYALERGGCVINAAVNLNGQPPIHCYARVIDEPVLRIGSIDLGQRVEITRLDDLLDYRSPTSEFALAKAALALSGFSFDAADWGGATDLPGILEAFGGGVELTTLAAIPKGSGLGTSSIVGAVILAVVSRVLGRSLTQDELFHGVLRLEQALTTGGGWQDQIGGAVDGVKIITAESGLVPSAAIHYVPADVLDPAANDGRTLLYYTGITRLAKNILQQVVGRYLDRDRAALATLRRLHALPARVSETMARKDYAAFGQCLDAAWRLNKQLDPDSTNPAVEELLGRIGPHIHGAKLLGAGGGGFVLMACRTAADAVAVREMLTAEPPNPLARFFDFSISREGLVVTVC